MKHRIKVNRFILLSMVMVILPSLILGCNNNDVDSTVNTITSSDINIYKSISEQQENEVLDWVENYPSIIEEYRKFVGCLLNEGIESVFDNNVFTMPDNRLEYNWDCMLIEANIWSYRDFPKTEQAFGYALKDLNGDGNNELVLLLQDYTVLAIFSTSDGKPKLIDAYWPRHRCAIYDTGTLYTLSSSGACDWYYSIEQISKDGNELLQIKEYGMTSKGKNVEYYKAIDGVTYIIDEVEINKFNIEYPILSNTSASEITKNSGFEFIPLFLTTT